MKKLIAYSLCILLVISFCCGYAEEEKKNETIVPNAVLFEDLDAPDVVDTAEHRKQTMAVIISYIANQKDDEICEQFSEAFKNNYGDMKVSIGAYKLGTTIAGVAFRNGDYYGITIIHYPQLSLKPKYRQYDKPLIEVEKVDNHYEDFEKVMKQLGKKYDITFYDLTSYDVISAIVQMYDSED